LWLDRADAAEPHYEAALEAGVADAVSVHRKLYELRDARRPRDETAQRAHLDRILALAAETPPHKAWAANVKVRQLLADGDAAGAVRLADEIAATFADTPFADEMEYLRALARDRRGDFVEAAHILTMLLQRGTAPDDVAARAGWLLGATILHDGRPQAAELQFADVIRLYPGGDWHTASLLGTAEAEVALGRYDRAIASFRELLSMPPPTHPDARVDRDVIRVSLTTQYEELRRSGRTEAALAMLELADELAVGLPDATRAPYATRLAELHVELAERQRAAARSVGDDDPELRRTREARAAAHLRLAGDALLRYSDLMTREAEISAGALFEAADLFDRAGDAEQTVETLRTFLRRWSGDARVSPVLFRLGQRLQAAGRYPEAIQAYERTLANYPNTPAAFQSYLPLAECFLAIGGDGLIEAERTLLAVVAPTTPDSVFTPSAQEYRDAVFMLGDLFAMQGRFEEAVTRYEEAVQRYPDDERITRAQFMLADAYRRSATSLGEELDNADQFREQVHRDFVSRMERAGQLFLTVAGELRERPAPLTHAEELHFQLAMLYRGDCLFDLGRYDEALGVYEEAAWTFHDHVRSISAYVQIMLCHSYLGQSAQGRAALARAQQIARKIPAEEFTLQRVGLTKSDWEAYLAWVGDSELF
jgi:tetratricopeptide (TPR) repeat protein